MIAFQRILFPVDFSARSIAAAPAVEAMAKRFGAELIVLHVVDLPPAGIAPPEASAWAALIGSERLREEGQIALERFVTRAFPSVTLRSESAEGDPASTIVDYARDQQADLIMMPTAGSGAFRRMLLGSVTAKVLHDTSVPVWTGVHAEDMAAHPPGRWSRMICALDGEQHDVHALQWAADFASGQGLELRLAHAVRGPQECENNPGFRQFLLDAGRERIQKLQDQAGTKLEVCIEVGKPGPIIHHAALGYSADLVVIGRGVIQKPLGRLRSDAYEIIREAPCPVISV